MAASFELVEDARDWDSEDIRNRAEEDARDAEDVLLVLAGTARFGGGIGVESQPPYYLLKAIRRMAKIYFVVHWKSWSRVKCMPVGVISSTCSSYGAMCV